LNLETPTAKLITRVESFLNFSRHVTFPHIYRVNLSRINLVTLCKVHFPLNITVNTTLNKLFYNKQRISIYMTLVDFVVFRTCLIRSFWIHVL